PKEKDRLQFSILLKSEYLHRASCWLRGVIIVGKKKIPSDFLYCEGRDCGQLLRTFLSQTRHIKKYKDFYGREIELQLFCGLDGMDILTSHNVWVTYKMPQNVNEDSNIDTKMSESNYENEENPKRFKGYYSKISPSTSNQLSSTLQSKNFTAGEFNTPSHFSCFDMKSLCLIVEESLAFALHSDPMQHDKHTLIIKA
ncbi:hypothetical protein HMI54_011440, partial [Coelomomyces lativittatus]